jgi:hypothetical protein
VSREKPPLEPGEPRESQWPDTFVFWLATTFATIAVSVAVCAGGFRLLRQLFTPH